MKQREDMTTCTHLVPSIVTRSLTTGYQVKGERRVISSDLDSTLYSGRLVCLLGPNGAGKSTLLRTLSGFQPPLSGEILLSGRSITDYTSRELSHLLSIVLTEKPILENMDVEALVALGRTPYTGFWGRLSDDDRDVIDRAIQLTGLTALRHRDVRTLSDGERQKAMIAKAFAQQTPIIFLDEPTAFLDYPTKVEIMLLLREMAHTQEKTIFLSTHDLEIALQISDTLWLLDRKHGLTVGTHRELTENGALGRYFDRPGIHYDPDDGHFKITPAVIF